MKSPKRLTKVTITAEIYVEGIRSDRAQKKIENNFVNKVLSVPYVTFASCTVKATEVDPETGEPNE